MQITAHEIVNHLLTERGYTQEGLANRIGVQQSTISKIFTNPNHEATESVYRKLLSVRRTRGKRRRSK